MRIIDEINRGELKVTVFKMNDRLSLKFEKDLNEVIFKFRDGSGIDMDNYNTYLNDSLLLKMEALLYSANVLKHDALERLNPKDDGLPKIL
ncbi:MAG TPA: hypothetical protein PKA12_15055 [Saprospiraceae bacterium]|nr:hypothetical protein [Saprospiraceae bacterium]